MSSRFIHVVTYKNCLPFQGWIISHRMYIPHFVYPFICWWTFGLLPLKSLRLIFCVYVTQFPILMFKLISWRLMIFFLPNLTAFTQYITFSISKLVATFCLSSLYPPLKERERSDLTKIHILLTLKQHGLNCVDPLTYVFFAIYI